MFDKPNRRPFATGSKPGPDAVDQYLEAKGFYRKHVARDASSVFRVVSDQVFDVQNFHEKLRQDCAAFLEEHAKDYSNEVEKNFYNYVSMLRRPRTHGTLLELRVMARMYKRNVILFEPAQNLQTTSSLYVHDDEYDAKNPLRVFYSQKDKHFDVIYTMEKVESLAECQAIVYDILYTGVFKLPDVPYAVEIMLHDQEEQVTQPLEDDPSKYKTQSGEIVPFDDSCNTNCVLKDPKTCHFHNQDDFEEVVNQQKDSITIINRTDDPSRLKIFKPIDGFLYDKTKSCVRQLLDEHITPFPYKVAKALDPSIYRNTEFELWSENRKEQRSKWFDSAEYPMKHMDDKWIFDRRAPYGLRKYSDGKFEAAVVDESAYMALDDTQKKKYVILNPGAEPFDLHQLTSNMDHFVPSKDSLDLTVMPVQPNYNRGGPFKGKPRGGGRGYNNYHGNYHQYNNNPGHSSFRRQYHGSDHQAPMPNVSDIERDSSFQFSESSQQQQQQESQEFFSQPSDQQGQTLYQEQCTFDQTQSQQPQMIYQGPPPSSWSNVSYVPYQVMGQPMPFAQPMNYQQVMPYGNFSIPPPLPHFPPPFGQGDQMRLIRDNELSSTAINWRHRESTEADGSDLPLGDIPTLQFFFNLGQRYYHAAGVQRQLETVASQLESLELNENASASLAAGAGNEKTHEGAAPKSELPPVPTNTPVTTKPLGQHRPPGTLNIRRQGGPRGDQTTSNNRDGNGASYRMWSNSRKEIKFNSNVKNAHKIDTKSGGSGHQVSTGSQAGGPPLTSTSTGNLTDSLTPNAVPAPRFPPYSPNNSGSAQQHQTPHGEAFPAQTPQHYYQSVAAQPQSFNYPPAGISMVYQMPDDAGYQLMQVQMPPYGQQIPFQVQTPQPFYYQVAPAFPQPGGAIDGASDSQADPNYYPPQYYQSMYITTTPIPQTPLTQMPPIFPAPGIPVHPPALPAVTVATQSQTLDRTVSSHSDENVGDNSSSA